MEKDLRSFWKLFRSTFVVSAFTFGGGFVIIPLLKNKFVDELHWIEEAEMLDLAAIAQSSPGAVAVNASILIGYRLAGFAGSLVTIAATVLPPLIILSVISLFYTAFRDSALVAAVLGGMRAGVAAVIADVVLNMGSAIVQKRRILPIAVMLCAFIAVYFFKVNVILLIFGCGIIGAVSTLYDIKHPTTGGGTE